MLLTDCCKAEYIDLHCFLDTYRGVPQTSNKEFKRALR